MESRIGQAHLSDFVDSAVFFYIVFDTFYLKFADVLAYKYALRFMLQILP